MTSSSCCSTRAAKARAAKIADGYYARIQQSIADDLLAMTGTDVEGTTSVRDAELYRLIDEARTLWIDCQKVYENHDKTVESYREMEERAMADFLDPHLELEKELKGLLSFIVRSRLAIAGLSRSVPTISLRRMNIAAESVPTGLSSPTRGASCRKTAFRFPSRTACKRGGSH